MPKDLFGSQDEPENKPLERPHADDRERTVLINDRDLRDSLRLSGSRYQRCGGGRRVIRKKIGGE